MADKVLDGTKIVPEVDEDTKVVDTLVDGQKVENGGALPWVVESLWENLGADQKHDRVSWYNEDWGHWQYLPIQEGPREPSRQEYLNKLFDLMVEARNKWDLKSAAVYERTYNDLCDGIHWNV